MSATEDFKNWAKDRISELNGQIEAAQQASAEAQKKIDRLNAACEKISGHYDTAKASKDDINNFSPGDSWAGNKRDTFNTEKDDARDRCNTYCDALLDVRSQLQAKRGELEAQQFDLIGLAQSWGNQVQDLWNKVWN